MAAKIKVQEKYYEVLVLKQTKIQNQNLSQNCLLVANQKGNHSPLGSTYSSCVSGKLSYTILGAFC